MSSLHAIEDVVLLGPARRIVPRSGRRAGRRTARRIAKPLVATAISIPDPLIAGSSLPTDDDDRAAEPDDRE